MASSFPKRLLAVDPFSRGVGFAVLEGPDNLIDFGLKRTGRADNGRSMRMVETLIGRFNPDVLALEDWRAAGSRRCGRVQQLLQRITTLDMKGIRVRLIARHQLRRIGRLPEVCTKYGRACILVERFPELHPFLPPVRKPWMAEDDRMGIFDAAAFALACFPVKVPTPEVLAVDQITAPVV
jgi:hypothetical protein